ncbi:MAG: hypothetical protein IRZ05_21560, partial [Micromonosporaceae bacterium]|nr:hypothetical protein [Micromonosporaceae bacterium]
VGTVDSARLVSHALVAVGYLVLVALSRPRFDFGDPPARRRPDPVRPVGDRAPTTRPATTGPRPPLRLVTRAHPSLTAALRPVRRLSAGDSTARVASPVRSIAVGRPSATRWERAA